MSEAATDRHVPSAASNSHDNSATPPPTTESSGSRKRGDRRHRFFTKKKSQRRLELDALKEKHKVFQIDPELYQVLLTPSDPDFPFPIPMLDFDLHVSRHYPNQGPPPWISVNNEDIPKGNAANVESAFRSASFAGTLSEKLDRLDNQLERLLTLPPARTITIVRGGKKDGNAATSVDQKGQGNSAQKKDGARPAAPSSKHKDKQSNSKESRGKETAVKERRRQNGPTASADAETPMPDIDILDVDSGSDSESSDSDENGGDYSPERADSSDEDEAYVHSSDEEDVDTGPSSTDTSKPKREGTELVFSDITLTNIALCEIVSLNLLFQCGRCKTMHTFSNVQSGEYGKPSKPRGEICSKCDLPLMIAFRKEYLHSNSHTAGYLDVDGGRAADLLPSSYVALCGQCQTPSPVFKNVDLGAQRMLNCRNCHAKMWLKVEMFSFVLLSTETLAPSAKREQRSKLPASAPKQRLNLVGGEPLPNHGACEHYRKSLRWFRFSCCQRVFACDHCHDNEMQHPAEQASRMVCGFCSREQRFNVKCVYCEHDYSHRVSRFWEGGKGTRDRALMSRNDKRKYKRDPAEHTKSATHFRGKSKAAPKH